jgi:plastocyanin
VRLRVGGIALGLSLVWAGPAFAANATVHAVEPGGVPTWDTQLVDILPGETVTWTFAGTTQAHNVESRGDNWSMVVPVALVQPDHTETFANEGT